MRSKLLCLVAPALCFVSTAAAHCSYDEYLREFVESSAEVVPFCATYAPGLTIDTAVLASSLVASISASGVTSTYEPIKPRCTTGLPPWASSWPAPSISSACSCLSAPSVTTLTPTSSSSTSTVPTSLSISSTLIPSTLPPHSSPSTSTTATSGSTSGPATATSTCKANNNWPGWHGINYAFIFGDSYTTTQFNETGIQPTPTNPLGNPAYPGYVSSNGPNWVDFLTVKYNESILLTYDIAWGGATIDSALVAPYLPTVSSVAEQVENLWFPNYASNEATPWSSNDTLFAIFDGINDVGNTWSKGVPATKALNAEIFAVYYGLVDELYYAGARNFLFLNVPPVDRAPLTLVQGTAAEAEENADILAWNNALTAMAKNLKRTYPDVNVFTIDTNELFTEVLDNPASFPATAQYQNTTAYCDAYENGTPTPTYFNATCGIPVDHYFWLNSLHPTYPMHDVLAQAVSEQLEAGPNIC